MIEIELTEPDRSVCECCGGTTTSLTRFVYQDGTAHAVYYLKFSDNHDNETIEGVISLGGWWKEEVPPERVAFPFRIWQTEENYNIGITSKDESPWQDAKVIGRLLDREEALSHQWIDEVFHLTDHIVEEDTEVVEFFNSPESKLVN